MLNAAALTGQGSAVIQQVNIHRDRPVMVSDLYLTPGEIIDGNGRTVKRLVLEGDLYGPEG